MDPYLDAIIDELNEQSTVITEASIVSLNEKIDEVANNASRQVQRLREEYQDQIESSTLFHARLHLERCTACQSGAPCMVGSWYGVEALLSAMHEIGR